MTGRNAPERIPDREAEALREIGATRAGRGLLAVLIAGFCCVALFGAVVESTPALRERTKIPSRNGIRLPAPAALGAAWRDRGWIGVNLRLLATIGQVNRYADRDAVATRLLRPPIQRALLQESSYGNGQVIAGSSDWLVYQQDFFHTVGPPFLEPSVIERRQQRDARLFPARQPDPATGLARLGRQLRRRGIQLVLVPAPNKVEVYPERLRPGTWNEPPRNASFEGLVERLEERGVLVFDPTPELFRAGHERKDLFFDGDSHWSPAGLAMVTEGLARFLRRHARLPEREPVAFLRRPVSVPKRVELERLLGLATRTPGNPSDRRVDAVEILWPDGSRYWDQKQPADVVVLGDSFSMVYSRGAREHECAGFAEHLAAELERPVHLLANFQHNDLANRTSWLRKKREILKRARVVVYEVAIRKLSTGDWAPGRLETRGRPRREKRTSPTAPSKETP